MTVERFFRGFFLHQVERKIFPYNLLHRLVPKQIQHKADFYKHNVMKDKDARLPLKSVILPFKTFSSLKDILILKSNCENKS